MQNLIIACWHKDPAKRPKFDTIVMQFQTDKSLEISNDLDDEDEEQIATRMANLKLGGRAED